VPEHAVIDLFMIREEYDFERKTQIFSRGWVLAKLTRKTSIFSISKVVRAREL